MTDSSDPAPDRQALVAGYLRYVEALPGAAHPDEPRDEAAERTHAAVDGILRHGPPELAWELVVEILRRAPDERLDAVAAGPLEDVVLRFGPALVDRIEREAERDERFRWALGCIWIVVGDLPAEVVARLVRASGGEIEPLDVGPIARKFLDAAT